MSSRIVGLYLFAGAALILLLGETSVPLTITFQRGFAPEHSPHDSDLLIELEAERAKRETRIRQLERKLGVKALELSLAETELMLARDDLTAAEGVAQVHEGEFGRYPADDQDLSGDCPNLNRNNSKAIEALFRSLPHD